MCGIRLNTTFQEPEEEKQELSSQRQKLKKGEFELLLDRNSKFIDSFPSDIYVEFH